MKSTMKEHIATILLVGLAIGSSLTTTLAFTATPALPRRPSTEAAWKVSTGRRRDAVVRFNQADDREDEIQRLQNMAAQLRAEAALLEAEQRTAMVKAAEHAFEKFDTDKNGEISLAELKAGLEKAFKTELPQKRVEQLMAEFDASGDGVLQLDEMVTVDKFRNKLDSLVREEKELAKAEERRAKEEQQAYQFLQATLELINDKEPSTQDKILSILPYLFPLLDGLQFAGPLIIQNQDNVVAQIAAVVYALYRSIPFGGFIAFFTLNFLSNNPRINRLVRYNMQQAIFLDIALFIPALLGAVFGLLGSGLGVGLPPAAAELGSDFLFFAMLLSVTYSSVSSLLGITPNKIPFISEAVERRMPSFEIMDTQGRLLTPEEREKKRKEIEQKKEEQKEHGDEGKK